MGSPGTKRHLYSKPANTTQPVFPPESPKPSSLSHPWKSSRFDYRPSTTPWLTPSIYPSTATPHTPCTRSSRKKAQALSGAVSRSQHFDKEPTRPRTSPRTRSSELRPRGTKAQLICPATRPRSLGSCQVLWDRSRMRRSIRSRRGYRRRRRRRGRVLCRG
jgi:hypothetical protein